MKTSDSEFIDLFWVFFLPPQERRALERKISEMEEELKVRTHTHLHTHSDEYMLFCIISDEDV